MKLDVEGIRRNDPVAMSEFYKLCKRSARIGASKVGAGEYVDDITQDMAMWIIDNFLPKYDPENDVDAYLIRVGEYMGRSHSRRGRREIQTGAPGLDQNSAFDTLEDESIANAALVEQEQIEDRAANARKILFAKIRQKKAERDVQRERDIEKSKIPPPEVERVDPFPSSATAPQLKDQVGFTFKQISEKLQQPVGVVRASLREGEGSNEIVEAVKELRDTASFDATTPVWKRMRHWCELLGISQEQPHWHVELGDLLEVHRVTMYRWRYGKTQPLPHMMRALDVYITELATARKKKALSI